ncbi:ABC transporter, permease protein, partial [mine drainage metagenome]
GGILTTTSLFTGMFAGVNIIWDRRLGPMARFLVSPISRSSIVFSKIISSTFRILVQAAILIGAALVIPNGLVLQKGFNAFGVFVIVVSIVLVAFSFSSIFSIIAIRLKKMETVFGIINLINLPLIFASYALFPRALMASWLGDVAQYNPISWSSVAIRTVFLYGNLTSSQTTQVLTYMLYLFLLAVFLMVLTYILSEKEIRD